VDRFCLKLRKISTETHKVFKNVYGNETLSHTHVLEWFKDSGWDMRTVKIIKVCVVITCLKYWFAKIG